LNVSWHQRDEQRKEKLLISNEILQNEIQSKLMLSEEIIRDNLQKTLNIPVSLSQLN